MKYLSFTLASYVDTSQEMFVHLSDSGSQVVGIEGNWEIFMAGNFQNIYCLRHARGLD